MIKTVYFTGFGFSQQDAIENANLQADRYIQAGNGRRHEHTRTFLDFNGNGAVYSAVLELRYRT